MSETDDTDVTQRAPFDPASADPTELEWLKAMQPKIYDLTSRKTNPRKPRPVPAGASTSIGPEPVYPLDPSNSAVHMYPRTGYKPVYISPQEKRMVNKILYQAKTLCILTESIWPPSMHVGIFVDDQDPQALMMMAALTPGRIGDADDQPNEFYPHMTTDYQAKKSLPELLRDLQNVLSDAQLQQFPSLDIGDPPVRSLELMLHVPLPGPPNTTGRPGGAAATPPRASPDVSTAVLQGLYAEIRNQVDLRKEPRGFLYIAVYKGEDNAGKVHMRAALAEPPSLSESDQSRIMRGEVGVPTVEPADMDALRPGQKTEWLATGMPFFAIRALLQTLGKDLYRAKQGGYDPIKLERRTQPAAAPSGLSAFGHNADLP